MKIFRVALSALLLIVSATAYSTTILKSTTKSTKSVFSSSRTRDVSFLSMKRPALPDYSDDDEPLLSSRKPQKLKNGRGTFLGFRNVKDVRLSSSAIGSSAALMPDGGLSPCVIRVLGVGGGGCNAVSC